MEKGPVSSLKWDIERFCLLFARALVVVVYVDEFVNANQPRAKASHPSKISQGYDVPKTSLSTCLTTKKKQQRSVSSGVRKPWITHQLPNHLFTYSVVNLMAGWWECCFFAKIHGVTDFRFHLVWVLMLIKLCFSCMDFPVWTPLKDVCMHWPFSDQV